MNKNEKIWSEKYRPSTLEECIVPKRIRDDFAGFIEQGFIPNVLLSGPPGIGKTSIAKVVCNILDSEVLIINSSMDRNIDTLRYDIQDFASTVSFNGVRKTVIFDEMDYLNSQSTQPALRNFIEANSENCAFMGTCNYPNKIIPELHSRMPSIDFNLSNDEKSQVAKDFYHTLKRILSSENVTDVDEKVLRAFLIQKFPDFRSTIGYLQNYIIRNGKIDTGLLTLSEDDLFKGLLPVLKSKKFDLLRTWIGENSDKPFSNIYQAIFVNMPKLADPSSIPVATVIMAKYLDMHSRSADQEITLTAALYELTASIKWL